MAPTACSQVFSKPKLVGGNVSSSSSSFFFFLILFFLFLLHILETLHNKVFLSGAKVIAQWAGCFALPAADQV